MAKRKQPTQYDLDALRELRGQLVQNDKRLVAQIRRLIETGTVDSAVRLKRAAEFLVKTRLVLETTLGTCEQLAEMTGKPQQVPFLDDCGLGVESEE